MYLPCFIQQVSQVMFFASRLQVLDQALVKILNKSQQLEYLLEMKYPHMCWVMCKIGTFNNPCFLNAQ